ncbi:hypothetical protein [Methanoplanus endosymbiosus]|uniref:Two component regulator propeller n=1 Tax=Methanoplanus endosymbiosus TaxID=33865 RepID=A0A9E7PM22_9EURY|nr:hypothetical protein [Methanoplanus endosymbiosus]UUX91832.1 hypothetical protein L6E24_10735 [Methanoplanus endosymbiosus]
MAEDSNQVLYFATSNGLSVYDKAEWEIFHAERVHGGGNSESVPYEDYITDVEFDSSGNLWLGYSDALQIYDGYSRPVTISAQDKFFVRNDVNKLESAGEAIFVSTGSSGLYRYYDGGWLWFQPYSVSGPDANFIIDMAADYRDNSLYIVSQYSGAFFLNNSTGIAPHFEKTDARRLPMGCEDVVSNPLGGVIFFNSSEAVVCYGGDDVYNYLDLGMLPSGVSKINDLAVLHDGRISVATDYGLVLLYDGVVVDHVTRSDGIAENNIKKTFPDSYGRVWFSTKRTVGYYYSPIYTEVSSAELVLNRETDAALAVSEERDVFVSSDESDSGNMPKGSDMTDPDAVRMPETSDVYSDKGIIDIIIGVLWPF